MAKKIKVTLIRSTIGQKKDKVATVRSLGLRRISSSAIHEDNASIRGMIASVSHIVKVEEVR